MIMTISLILLSAFSGSIIYAALLAAHKEIPSSPSARSAAATTNLPADYEQADPGLERTLAGNEPHDQRRTLHTVPRADGNRASALQLLILSGMLS